MIGATLLAIHVGLATAFTGRVALGMPYIYHRITRYKVACGDRNAMAMMAGPPIQRAFAMVIASGIIGVLGLFGAYAFSLKHDGWRFFRAYTRKDMDSLVSRMAAKYDERRGSE